MTLPTLHKINYWALSITLILYLTLFFGMLALLLGIIQLLIAMHITTEHYQQLDKKLRRLLNRYWIAAAISLTSAIAAITLAKYTGLNDIALIVIVFVLPMLVAIYLAFVTNAIKRFLEGKP